MHLNIFKFPINQVLTLDRVFLELVKDLLHSVLMVFEAIVFQKPSKTVLSINKRSPLILKRYIFFFVSITVSMGSEVLTLMSILFHKYGNLVLQSFPLLLALHIYSLVVDSISVAISIIDVNIHVLAIDQWILVVVIVDCVFLISRPL